MSGVVSSVLGVLDDLDDSYRYASARATLEGGEYVAPRIPALLDPRRRKNAALLWVSSDMAALLRHAACSLPPYAFAPDVLPWPSAVCVSAAPMMTLFDPAEPETYRWPLAVMQWFPLDPEDTALLHRDAFVVSGIVRYGQWLTPLAFAPLRPGQQWDLGEPSDGLGMGAAQSDEFARLCCTLWLLLQQKVAVKRRAWSSRADRRRWDREHDKPVPEITVVELRKPISVNPYDRTEMPVDWSHRWIVDGHWRNQYHPSSGEHVPTWIAPHVKGPEDKPLVVKRKVHAWVR